MSDGVRLLLIVIAVYGIVWCGAVVIHLRVRRRWRRGLRLVVSNARRRARVVPFAASHPHKAS